MDLKFPHHENEIAQTCAACDSTFVNVWMHNGFVRVDDEKMSKSLGNFFTVREVLGWVRDPEVVRYLMVNSQYRGPINYSPDSLTQADAALERLYLALRGVSTCPHARGRTCARARARDRALRGGDGRRLQHADGGRRNAGAGARDQYRQGGRRSREGGAGRGGIEGARHAARVARARAGGVPAQARGEAGARRLEARRLGSSRAREAAFVVSRGVALSDADIDRLIDERAAARKAKNFKESDRIRDLLAANGVVLEDMPGGKTLWRRG